MSKSPRHRRPLIEALEPRLLFSATADIAVFDDGNSDVQYLALAAEQADLVSIYMPTEPLMMASQSDDQPQADIAPASTSSATTLVFVDTAVDNYQTLVEDIRSRTDASSTAIIYLDASKDGLTQISDYLTGVSGISAIHVISHGVAGNLQLGTAVLNEQNIAQYTEQLAAWKTALGDDADILLYGCDLAANQSGLNLLHQLSDLTGADVAASNDLTGNSRADADWVLEENVGNIETESLFAANEAMAWQGELADITYINTGAAANAYAVSSTVTIGQTIQHDSAAEVDRFSVMMRNSAAAAQTITLNLLDGFAGNIIATSSISSSAIGSSFGWVNFDFSSVSLAAYSTHWLRISSTGSDGLVSVAYHNTSVYNGGIFEVNGNGDSSKDLSFAMINVDNQAPTVANAIPNQNATEDSAFNFQFAANTFADVDVGNTLTYTAQLAGGGALPAWLSFDAATRTFSGTPLNANVGTVAIDVIANDGNGGTVTDTFDIVVANVNDAPTVSIALTDYYTNEQTAVNLHGTGITVNDVDSNTVTVTFAGPAPHSQLTANVGTTGATISSGNGTPSLVITGTLNQVNDFLAGNNGGTLTYRLAGDTPSATATLTITANDGALSGNDTATINITALNDAPVNTVPGPQATDEDTALVFSAGNGNQIQVNDVDRGAGDLEVTLSVTNGTLTLAGVAGLVFTTGDGTNDSSMVFRGTQADINTALATLTFAPTANYNGAAVLSITTSDLGNTGTGGVLTDTDNVNITVNAINDAPVNTVPGAQVTNKNVPITFSAGNSNQIQIADIDAGAATNIEVTLSVSNGVLTLAQTTNLTMVTGDGTADSTLVFRGTVADLNAALATLTFTPANNYTGGDTLSITTKDQGNTGAGGILMDQDLVGITINNNQVPTVSNAIPNQNATEDAPFSFQFAANTFADGDVGDTLTYTAQLAGGGALPAWLSFNAATRTFSGTPTNAFVGTVSIDVIANDGSGGTVTDTFDIVVANTNDGPTVANPIPNQNATEDAAFNFQFALNTFADVDVGDTLTYTAQLAGGGALPAWLSFDPVTRTFSGTPTNAFVGTVSIDVIADDSNGGTVTDTFDIVVANTNDAPTAANPIPNQTATENALFNFSFAVNAFNDQDVGDSLAYTAQLAGGGALPAWLSFDAATRTFSGTPSNGDVGTINVEVIATDGSAASVSDFFSLEVENVGSSNVTYETSGPAGNTQTLSAGVPLYQSFLHDSVGPTYTVDSIIIQLVKDPAASVQTITVSLISGTYNGVVLASDTISSADIDTTIGWKAFTFAGQALNDNQLYFIKVETSSADGLVRTGIHNTDVYPNGSFHSSTGVADTSRDLGFQVASGSNNNPALANPIANQNTNEDAPYSFQFAANVFTDADVGDTLTYTAAMADGSALPGWLSFDPSTRTFSGTPLNGDVGTISIRVTADDSRGGTPASDTFDLTIVNTNDAPTVANPIADRNATEDQAFNFTFAANTFADQDVGNTLTYSAQLAGGGALPAWLSFDPVTRTFSGTPTNAFVGTVSIDVIADDGNGGTVTDTFDIVVANTNDAPTIANAIPNQNATEDAAFNFQFALNTFADVDVGDTLTYTAQLAGGGALPAWLSFDAATRTFSGTPLNANVGTVAIDVIANDGNGGTVTDTFDIVVANTNDVPTVANPIPNQNATEDAAFNFQFALNTFADVDVGDTLTYSSQLAGGGALPAWLSFDAATRTFSGTPTNAFVGTVSIDVIADDGNGGTVTDTFDIVVANSNDAPTVANAIANQNATEDAAFNFQFAANVFADSDVGDTLTYTAQLAGGGALPAWLSFDPVTRTFSGTPTNAFVGTVSIDVIADDGNGGTVTDTFDIVVANTNDAPTIANAIPNQNATEDAAFNFQFALNTFADVDVGDTLTYTAQLAGGGALPAWLSFDPVTRTFSGTPTNAFVGTFSIDVIADDGNGGTVTDTFDIVVANTNDAPTIANAIPNQNATEDAAFSFQFAANVFADSDVGDTLTYTAQLAGGGAIPAWLSFDPATRTFSGTPLNANVGTVSIDVIADDGNGGTVTDTFDIVVANSNDAPTIANAIPNQNATEDAAFNFQFAANTFADVDVGDTLTYTAQLAGGGALPAWLSFDPVTRTFSGTPTNAFVGTVSVDVIADDGNGGTVTDTFDIVVANSNDAPTIANAIPNQNATEDAAFNFQFAANSFADTDVGDTLTYTSQLAGGGALPAWLSFDPVTRTFSGTPTNAFAGTVSIDVIADDGNGGTVTDTFDIVVANTNDAPTIANAIPNQNATEDAAFNFQFAANTFADPDVADTLTYAAQLAGGGALPAWLSFDAGTRTFSGTPVNANVGTISIDVTADDGNGGTVTDTFNIVIANSNDAPTVATPIANQTVADGAAFNFQFGLGTFADVDVGDTFTYSAALNGGGALPAWLAFDDATRTFSGVPATGDVGILTIDVTASDGNGGTVTDTFTLTVNDLPDTEYIDTGNGGAQIPLSSANPLGQSFSYNSIGATYTVNELSLYLARYDNAAPQTITVELRDAWNGAILASDSIASAQISRDGFGWHSFSFADVALNDQQTYVIQISSTGNDDLVLVSRLAGNTYADGAMIENGVLDATGWDLAFKVAKDDGSNGAPVLDNPIADQTLDAEVPFNLVVPANTFSDPDPNDTITYRAQLAGGGGLDWLTFNEATRTFAGTPHWHQAGTMTVELIATDNHGTSTSAFFDVEVINTNNPPTVANPIPDQLVNEDSPLNFQFAANTFGDVDVGNTFTYSAELAVLGGLPPWLSFDAATRTFSGIPANGDVGTWTVEVTANDGFGGEVIDTFVITVTNNTAPTLANPIPDRTATEDAAFNFQFAANTFADVDAGTSFTYSAQLVGGAPLPVWLSFDSATRTFSGTPDDGDVGTLSIQVTADDGTGSTISDTFDIAVANNNDAPTIANSIPDQNAAEDATFNFQFAANTFADADVGASLTYSAQLTGGGALPAWLSFNAATRMFSGTPTNTDLGTLTIAVTASDGLGGTVTETFDLVVANTNDAPTVAFPIADQNATENSAFSFTVGANVFADEDAGDTLTFSAQLVGGAPLPAWLSFDAVTRTFSGTPAAADSGTLAIQITASDGNGGSIAESFNLTTSNLPVNAPPFVQNIIADQLVAEDSPLLFTLPAATFVDPEGDLLSYSVQLVGGAPLPAWLSFDAVTRTFSGTPANGDVGVIDVQVTVSDSNGGTVSDRFTITVANTNDAPLVANAIPHQNATEGTTFNFQFNNNTFVDEDPGTNLTYNAQLADGGALPVWLSFDAATRTFSGTPAQGDTGNLVIHILASDSIATVTTQFQLAVVAVNDVPQTTGSVVIDNLEDAAGDQVDLWGAFSDQETASRDLAFSIVGNSNPTLVSGASIDPATGKLQLRYGVNQFGNADLVVRAQDQQGAWVETLVRVNIESVNDVPVSSGIADIKVQAGAVPQQMNLQNVSNDIENGRALAWTLVENSNSAVATSVQIDPATGLMTLAFSSQSGGDSTITLRAQDSDGAWVETRFKVTVTPAEVLPPPVSPPVTPPVEAPVPPMVPPAIPPTVPPTAEVPDGAGNGTDELPNLGGNDGTGITPPGIAGQPLAVDTGDSERPESGYKDKSSRDIERAEEMLSGDNIPLTTLTASTNLASLIALDAGFTPWEAADFDNEVRRLRAQMDEAMLEEQDRKAVVAGITFSVTTGLLVWSLRASSLLLTMMSMLPLWRGLDPLPILDEVNKKKKELEQQRKDREREDKSAKEVGYLFDHAQRKEPRR